MTSDLVTWLRAQLDADEAKADAALHPPPGYYDKSPLADTLREMAMQALDEVAAKRRILDIHERWQDRDDTVCRTCGTPFEVGYEQGVQAWPCPTLLALAQVYAGRSGWLPEWETA